jgi:hypothetical protein
MLALAETRGVDLFGLELVSPPKREPSLPPVVAVPQRPSSRWTLRGALASTTSGSCTKLRNQLTHGWDGKSLAEDSLDELSLGRALNPAYREEMRRRDVAPVAVTARKEIVDLRLRKAREDRSRRLEYLSARTDDFGARHHRAASGEAPPGCCAREGAQAFGVAGLTTANGGSRGDNLLREDS